MRILFWVPQFAPDIGGIEVWSSHLLPALQVRGHEFLVVSSRTRRKAAEPGLQGGIPVRKFDFERALQQQDIAAIKAILLEIGQIKQTFRPDLIHMNTSQGGAYFHLLTHNRRPAPVLFSLHYLNEGDRLDANSLMGRSLMSADWVSAVSQFMLASGLSLVPDIASRSSVVVNGLPWPGAKPTPLPADEPRLLVMGRVVVQKGFDLALEAFAIVRRQCPAARLVVAGSGEALPSLRLLASDLGVQDSVDFVGWVDPPAIPELINTATLVVAPSRWEEPFGLVALEAAQMGRPVVATNVGGLGEVVVHGETGLLAPREDPAALAEAILSLLANPQWAQSMGQAGRERASSTFSFERMVDAYDILYRQLAPGRA